MPGIHIDFTQEEYEAIPGKKRTWVRELIRSELRRLGLVKTLMEKAGVVPGQVDAPAELNQHPRSASREPEEYYFRWDGNVVSAKGMSAAMAAASLGIRGYVDWRTREDAIKDKWIDEPAGAPGEAST